MPKQLSLDIADLSVTLHWDEPLGSFKLPAAYQPFIHRCEKEMSESAARFSKPGGAGGAGVAEEGGIRLQLAAAAAPPQAGTVVFENAPIWSLYRVPGGLSFRIFESYNDLKRTLFIPDNGGGAHLAFQAANQDPFSGPTFELLMIALLARRGGVLLHGCGISVDGRGMVFAGESGAGKSTLSRLWAREEGIEILSDDRVVVRRQNGSFYLYGTPWHGDEAFAAPGGVELSRIFFIRHGPSNDIRKLSAAGAVREMLKCSFPPLWDAGGMAAALELFHGMATEVPRAELDFVPDRTAVDYVLAMSGGRISPNHNS
jgi:hypothetical protein